MKKPFIIISILLIIFSCKKDELGPQCINCDETPVIIDRYNDVIIINEGNFGSSPGSVSLYKSLTKKISNNVFQNINGNPIGNVAQSAFQIEDKAYIVVNNSNKIEAVNINTLESITTIDGFNSPRYFLPINDSTAYVTDLYANSIQILNLKSNSISGNIPVNGRTEELLMYNDTVYVCDMTNDNLLIIDPSTNNIIDSIKTGESPNSIVLDKNNKIWILSSGGFSSTNPNLIKFNPSTRLIESTYTFPNINESPSNLKINGTRDQLYFINTDIFQLKIEDSPSNLTPFITSNNRKFYGIGVHPANEEVYVSDAIDFNQNGEIYRYSSDGLLIDQFIAGRIPGYFLFIK